jgi:glycosyltransferase EpsE
MAVYNNEKTLRRSIDSVLDQTYQNWKFIICNDSSTDKTAEILDEYANKYPDKFLIIKNEVNSKLAFSLNRCLEYAQGEYCARMDGDDYISPKRFEKQVEYLKRHPEIKLVGTFMQGFDDEGKFTRIYPYKEFPNKYDLKRGPCFAHASIMIYTKVLKELCYVVSNRTKRSQDYDLWFRFFAAGYKGANIQEALYFVREDEYAFLRRKPSLYFWAVITRFKGYKLLHYPFYYYGYAVFPVLSFFKNEIRKTVSKVRLKKKKRY